MHPCKILTVTLFFMLISLLLVSCYPMPGEDECSLVPLTNNPSITREKGSGFMNGTPEIKY